MKILIAVDMEGVSGVVHWDQVDPNHSEYPRYQLLMTEDVNAAIRGASTAGADVIIVSDGHNNGRNILIEKLDPRARLNTGSPSPLSMVQGVDSGVDGVLFIGYHARKGTPNAILEHTWSDMRIADFWMRGDNQKEFIPYGEIGLNAAVCGHFGVPVLMISGDQAACAEAKLIIPEIDTAIVKWAVGRMAAECLHPEEAQQKIQQASYQAVSRLVTSMGSEDTIKPFSMTTPITLAIDFAKSEMADRAAIFPGASRSGRRIEYQADDMLTIYQVFRAIQALAA